MMPSRRPRARSRSRFAFMSPRASSSASASSSGFAATARSRSRSRSARAPDGREVALKVLARTDAVARARFERERRLLASLGEAHGFVPLLDSGAGDDGAWLVMPLMRGGSLRDRLARGRLGVEETLAL